MKDKVRITQHDILTLKVDAIICQANQELEPEDSEVKRIFQNGGDEVYSECDHQNNLAVGSAVITSAGELPISLLSSLSLFFKLLLLSSPTLNRIRS